MTRNRVAAIVTAMAIICGLVFAAVRMFAVVWHAPVIGYANNYDMLRLSACVGAWPIYPAGKEETESNIEAPVPSYTTAGGRSPADCYWSSELLFVWAAKGTSHVADALGIGHQGKMDIRILGTIRAAAFFLLLAGLTSLLWRRSRRASLFFSWFSAVVLADPFLTLYFNGLYAEFSGLFFLTSASVLAIGVSMSPSPRASLVAGAFATMALLGASKIQDVLLPALPAAVVVLRGALGARRRAILCAVALLAIGAPFAFHSRNPQRRITRLANATDTVLFTLIPAAPDANRALAMLGLPESCRSAVGLSWYSPGVSDNHPCPEVGRVSPLRIVALIATQPRAFVVPLSRALAGWNGLILKDLGQVEGERFGLVSAQTGVHLASLDGVFAVLPSVIRGAAFWLMLPALALVVWRRIRRCGAANGSETLDALLLSGGTTWTVLVTSLLGDGYADFEKHSLLAIPSMAAFWSLAAGSVIGALIRVTGRERRA